MLLPPLWPKDHNACIRNRSNTPPSFTPSFPVQFLSGTTSQPLSPQPLHWCLSRIDLAAVSTICGQSLQLHNNLILCIVLTPTPVVVPIEGGVFNLNPRLRPEPPAETHCRMYNAPKEPSPWQEEDEIHVFAPECLIWWSACGTVVKIV